MMHKKLEKVPTVSYSKNILHRPEWVAPDKPVPIPLLNKNVLNGRPDNVLKDGVWIQVQPYSEKSLAVHDAIIEQERIDRTLQEKEERLRKFQQDVQRRVTRIARAQKQLATKTQSQNMREEQNILYRSVTAAETLSPMKNRCSYNINPVTIDASGKLTTYQRENDKIEANSMLELQSTEVGNLQRKARLNLVRRRLIKQNDTDEDNNETEPTVEESLPGGYWGTSVTRDKSGARLLSKQCETLAVTDDKTDLEQPETVTALSAPHNIAIAAVQEGIMSSPAIKSKLNKMNVTVTSNLPEAYSSFENTDQENEDPNLQFPPAPASSLAPSSVHFRSGAEKKWKKQEVIPCDRLEHASKNGVEHKIVSRMGNSIKPHRCIPTENILKDKLPCVAPGVIEHEKKKMDQQSRLLCRRVFSDMERENVREERRRRDHKLKVDQLRADKEAERLNQENAQLDKIHAADLELEEATLRKQRKEEMKIKRREEKSDRQKRTTRFVSALKAQIKEKLQRCQVELPPLCCCATTFWETDPYTCANNCVFYRNIEAYTYALQSVLSSVEKNLGTCRHEKVQDYSVISLLMNDD